MTGKGQVGQQGEEVAVAHLREAGFTVLDRNWRCEAGELDVVALDGDVLVFCEVKTRTGLGFGSPLEGVTRAKAARQPRLAARWMAEHGRPPGGIRFDVVGVLLRGGAAAHVEHVRGSA